MMLLGAVALMIINRLAMALSRIIGQILGA